MPIEKHILPKAFFTAFIICMTFFSEGVSANVDDSTVKKWIKTGSLQESCSGPASTELDLSGNLDPKLVAAYWYFLKSCRDGGQSADLNLAAAEWYLFIRSVASETGDTFLKQLPEWYSTVKKYASKLELSEYLQTSDQPVSKTNPDVTKWGNLGVEHGLRDYEKRTKNKPELKSDGFMTGWDFITDRLYNSNSYN
ncbi:hypothetical protein [Vibrio alfacsensis]|uniref:hypothetical protein n=1 Tax=Vibrio alfacsensis TaxID=1074311 RepID=UPI004068B6BF